MARAKRNADLVGQVFGRLTVLHLHDAGNGRRYYWCRCECGAERPVRASQLTAGYTLSCGCFRQELCVAAVTTHGRYGTPEWRTWSSMKSRCLSAGNEYYRHYGGRGIKVCARWLESFENFLADMGERPSGDKYSIDRINNDGNYSCGHCEECLANGWPANCRWATQATQENNKRSNRLLTYGGKTQTINQWARELGLPNTTIRDRIAAGWSVDDTFNRPSRKKQRSS